MSSTLSEKLKTNKLFRLFVGTIFILSTVFLFQLGTPDTVYAGRGNECHDAYDRTQPRGNPNNTADYVLGYVQSYPDKAPEVVCGTDAQGDDIRVALLQWGPDAGSWLGDSSLPDAAARYLFWAWTRGEDHASFIRYSYATNPPEVANIVYLNRNLTVSIDGSSQRVDDPVGLLPLIEQTEENGNEGVGTNPDDVTSETPGPELEEDEECVNEGGLFGVLMCDALVWTLSALESVQSLIVEVLFETKPLIVGDTSDPLFQIWGNIRDVANILLVVAFMFVIYSLAVSVNIDAYSVKRIVPRLLVAAVSIQASYFISAIFIDMTSILGAGIQGFTDIAMDDVRISLGNAEGAGGFIALGSIAGLAVAGGILLAPSIGLVAVIILLVVLAAFVVVAARDLLILMCVVLSPIAFLANLLPNTEKWFKFWWSNFARLLFMYPFMILMIQIGNLGAYIALSANREASFLAPFMALIMQGVAIGSILLAFKVGGSLLSVTTSGFQKFAKGGGGRSKDGKGLRGKIGQRARERRGEYATGTRGNAFTRGITSPATASVMPSRFRNQSRAQALSGFNLQRGEAAKALEAEGHDADALNTFARYGESTDSFKQGLKELRSSTRINRETGAVEYKDADDIDRDNAKADKLANMSHHVGKRAFQAAALKQVADMGFADNESFESVRGLLQDNPTLSQQVLTPAAVGAKKAGRIDQWKEYGPLEAKDIVAGMGTKDIVEMKPVSLKDAELANQFRDQASVPKSAARKALSSALGSASGMSAKQHEEFERVLGPDLYAKLVEEAEEGWKR
ncbi:MAG: hypothetical protein WD467_02035 [Candidatus Saccharimonadales bacterium]